MPVSFDHADPHDADWDMGHPPDLGIGAAACEKLLANADVLKNTTEEQQKRWKLGSLSGLLPEWPKSSVFV